MNLRTFAVAALVTVGCSKPQPPRITPKTVTVTSISPEQVGLAVGISVENPNGVDLSAQAVTAKLTLDNSVEIGTVTLDTPFTLPAKQTVDMTVPVAMPWTNLVQVAPLAQRATVPYAVEGTVRIGGKLSIDLPFRVQGVLSRLQLLHAIGAPGLHAQ